MDYLKSMWLEILMVCFLIFVPMEAAGSDERCLKWLKSHSIYPGDPDCEMKCGTALANLWESISCVPRCPELCKTLPWCEGISAFWFYGRRITWKNKDNKTRTFKAISGSGTEQSEQELRTASEFMFGPIPEGCYSFLPNEMTEANILHPIMWFKRNAWGKYRIPLHPIGKSTTTRSGFFIHGGQSFGSAGCIDVNDNESQVFNLLFQDLSRKEQKCQIKICVKYRD